MDRLTNVVDNANCSVTNWCNNRGLVVGISNAAGCALSLRYDALGQVTNTLDATGVAISASYDYLGRLLERDFPDGGAERFAYTANVLGLTGYTNQLGTNVLLAAYDAAGRMTNVIYPTVATNAFAYNPSGLLTNLVDGNGRNTAWRYNQYRRMTNKVDALGNSVFVIQYRPGRACDQPLDPGEVEHRPRVRPRRQPNECGVPHQSIPQLRL